MKIYIEAFKNISFIVFDSLRLLLRGLHNTDHM